jgi:hypothetical protein
VTVGRDLAEVHRANRALALKYFERMRRDVDAFVRDVYRPFIIQHTIRSLDLINRIQRAAASSDGGLDALDIMEIYADRTLSATDSFHAEMLRPIEEQERQVIASIDDAFQRLQNANAVVTGHLASVRKVQDAQAEFLGRFGQPGLPERVGGAAAALSDNLASILERGRKVQSLLDQGPAKLDSAGQELTGVLDEVKLLRPRQPTTSTPTNRKSTESKPTETIPTDTIPTTSNPARTRRTDTTATER